MPLKCFIPSGTCNKPYEIPSPQSAAVPSFPIKTPAAAGIHPHLPMTAGFERFTFLPDLHSAGPAAGAHMKNGPRDSHRGAKTLINLKDRKTHLEIPLGQSSFLFCRNHFNEPGCGRCFQIIVPCNRKYRPRTAKGRKTAVVPIRSLQFVTDAAEP